MTKSNKGRRRRKNSKHYEDSDDENDVDNHHGSKQEDRSNGLSPGSDAAGCKLTTTVDISKAGRKHKNLSFAEKRELQRKAAAEKRRQKRELQRKAAAEKRRQKMKCYLCGKTGHVRRECPGIADDGRGESKYTKSNGDAGAAHLKQKGRNNNKKHTSNSSSNSNSGSSSNGGHGGLALPPGFEKFCDGQEPYASPYLYYDTGSEEGHSILDYLRFGRHGHGGGNHHHTQVSKKDAIAEYDASMRNICETTNFGGCIVRSYLPTPNTINLAWEPKDNFPFSWAEDTPSLLKFVIGYPFADDAATTTTSTTTTTTATTTAIGDEPNHNTENNSDRGSLISEEMVHRLVETANHHKGDVVGFFADLDYTAMEMEIDSNNNSNCNNRKGKSSTRDVQLQRLRSTLKAASAIDCPLQIRIAPGYKVCGERSEINSNANDNALNHGYSLAIRDLGKVLLEASVISSWKVHISSWNGKAEHLVALSGAFSSSSKMHQQNNDKNDNDTDTRQFKFQHELCFGFDGSLGFSKAVHLHESAFEVCPQIIVLETGGPGILPPIVAKHCGRNAFCHSGQIPFVAEELAKHLSRNPRNTIFTQLMDGGDNDNGGERIADEEEITAEKVARWASTTTKTLYGLQ